MTRMLVFGFANVGAQLRRVLLEFLRLFNRDVHRLLILLGARAALLVQASKPLLVLRQEVVRIARA